MIELLPVGGDEDLATWVDVHNRVSPTPVTAEEVAGYRDVLDAELHLLALRTARRSAPRSPSSSPMLAHAVPRRPGSAS